jgi:hypothetical protein
VLLIGADIDIDISSVRVLHCLFRRQMILIFSEERPRILFMIVCFLLILLIGSTRLTTS